MKEKRVRKLARKGKIIRQVAALPFRTTPTDGLEVLLLTSRQTARFVIPKGWPMKGMPDWKAAALEAKQEAGITGRTAKTPLGTYQYWKRLRSVFVRVTVSVFALEVEQEKGAWREKSQRRKQWLGAAQALALVDEPDLAVLIEEFSRSVPKAP